MHANLEQANVATITLIMKWLLVLYTKRWGLKVTEQPDFSRHFPIQSLSISNTCLAMPLSIQLSQIRHESLETRLTISVLEPLKAALVSSDLFKTYHLPYRNLDSTLLEPLILSPEDVSSPASEPLTTPPRNSYGQTNFKTCAWNHTKVDSSGFSGFSGIPQPCHRVPDCADLILDLITRFDPTTSRDQGLSLIPANDHSEEFDDTPALFQGFPVEEAPSPFHAPVVGETPDFTDSRDGAVGFPMRWESNIAQPESCSIEAHDVTFACNGPKLEAFLETQSTTNEQKRPLSPMSVVEETGAKPKYYEISRYSDVPSGCRKRRARDSFSTESTYEAGRGIE